MPGGSIGSTHRVSLGSFYFLFFATLGVYLPYFTLYLERLGFDPVQIALAAAILPLIKATAPIFWGMAADRTGRRWELTVLTCALAAASAALFLGVSSFAGICLVLALYSVFHSGSLPLVEATALENVGQGRAGYGGTRVWGSIGFITVAGAWGWWLDRAGMHWVIYGLVALSILKLGAALALPRARQARALPAQQPLSRVPRPAVGLFFAATLLQQASHGPYYAYFSLHLESLGWSRTAIGGAWVVGVLSEVLMMIAAERWIARWGLQAVLVTTHAAALVRWVLLSALFNPLALMLAQTLHAFTFGAFHVSAVRRTQRLFPPARRGLGLSLYSALTYGAGSAVGFFGSGLLHGLLGVRGLFLVGAGTALAAALIQGLSGTVERRQRGAFDAAAPVG
ncbi:MAG: MFS transporter [Acidobacteriota bacterium]